MNKEIYVLHSGFVTGNTGRLNRNTQQQKTLREKISQDKILKIDTDNLYDEVIENLFHEWRNDNNLALSFDFREKVLEAAIRVFNKGNGSFTQWIGLQDNQRTVGYLHRKFILESMNRVLNNKPRTTEVYNFYMLLSPRDSGTAHQTRKDSVYEEFSKITQNSRDLSTTGILFDWTKDVSGFCDMLNSLHVIFGRRSEVVS